VLPGVTLVHKGLTPSGLSSIKLNITKELLLNLPFKAYTKAIVNCGFISNYNVCSPLWVCNNLKGKQSAIGNITIAQSVEKT